MCTFIHTHTNTNTQWHINKETEREGEEKKKVANVHHRCCYCIIDFAKDNMDKTSEATENLSSTSPTFLSQATDLKEKQQYQCQYLSVSEAKLDSWAKQNKKHLKQAFKSHSTFCKIWLIRRQLIISITDNSKIKKKFPSMFD